MKRIEMEKNQDEEIKWHTKMHLQESFFIFCSQVKMQLIKFESTNAWYMERNDDYISCINKYINRLNV